MNAAELVRQGSEHHRAARFHQAEVLYRKALELDPNCADAWHLLGMLADQAGQSAAAVELIHKAIALAPQQAIYFNNLGTVHEGQGDYDRAAECLRQAIRLRPEYAAAHHNLAEVCKACGRLREALALYRRALELDPDHSLAADGLLMLMNYDPEATAEQIASAHRAWGARLPPAPTAPHVNSRDPDRRLRIGYVSPDFRKHAVARFLEPILVHHDRAAFAVFLYAEVPGSDAVTERLRQRADGWRVTVGRSAPEVAAQVRADGIDLLIDLAGHTRHNRLDVFRLRPAPVQATYLGYPNTTGLAAIDYRITDAVVDPPGEPERGAERLVRLPGSLACFAPPAAAPECVPPPCLQRGHVTFGSHHPPIKLNPAVFGLWRRVMQAVPNAHLLLLRSGLTAAMVQDFQARLCGDDIAPDRFEAEAPGAAGDAYLSRYERIDVVLDCFPFTGHTMTCEALWMGVPVVTLLGDRPAGRLSASVLTALGLTELIAETPDEYVAIARRLAGDPQHLARLRGELRARMRQRLCDGAAFTAQLEATYRALWRDWCAKANGGAAPSRPDPAALLQQGQSLRQQGKMAEALAHFRAAIWAGPSDAEVLRALAAALLDGGAAAEAAAAYRQALQLRPDDAALLNDLGNALQVLGQTEEAVAVYRRALGANPDLAAASANLARLLAEDGETEAAREQFRHAYRLNPLPRLRLIGETLLPVLCDSMDHLRAARQQFADSIAQLEREGVRIDPTQEQMPTHFYLAYHGLNDRDLHAAIARLGGGPRQLQLQLNPARGKKIRLGFLSRYLCNHTIGQLNHGLIAHIDRNQFEVVVLAVGAPTDLLAQRIARSADRYVPVPLHIPTALRLVAEQRLDILHFPDIGMDGLTYTLAFSRLAPVQTVTWGHPVTTGLPTVDYFFSSRDLEVQGSEDQYTEQLVHLPRLGVVYERPQPPASAGDRSRLGLPEGAHTYACPQTLFKFHPEFDEVLAGILRADPAGLLVLIEPKSPRWRERLLRRFARTMPDVADRVRFVPRLSRPDFLQLLSAADVMLDPLHFDGGNTSYEGLSLGVPIVTLPSAFLRGRLTYAMYRQMGLLDLVARDTREYVQAAVHLGTDPGYRREVSEKFLATNPVLFDDVAIVRDLEQFWLDSM